MKERTLARILILTLILGSCGSTKNAGSDKLFGPIWELEYISGPRIAFQGLFPDRKPHVFFDREANTVTGNAGCNGYSADYTLDGNTISFGEPGPTTMMFCGGGERQFLNMMKKVDAYSFDAEGRLDLMIGDVPMLRFKKSD